MRLRFALLVAALSLLVGCDHATKHLAETHLRGAAPVSLLPGVLQLRYAQNDDIAFNLLRAVPSEVRQPLILVAGLLAVALLLLLWRRARGGAQLAACALLLGGALGNLADRVARGYVVDFIHVEHWPVFNVADTWVTLGVALFVYASARAGPAPAPG